MALRLGMNRWLLWVRSGLTFVRDRRPLYPQELTSRALPADVRFVPEADMVSDKIDSACGSTQRWPLALASSNRRTARSASKRSSRNNSGSHSLRSAAKKSPP